MTLPYLPTEVTDTIIDCLESDITTLRSCLLTCRAWVYASRAGLFHTVTLRERPRTDTFLALLISSPWIGQHVRTLILKCAPLQSPADNVLATFVGALPGLVELQLWDFFARTRASAMILGGFSTLQTLSLSTCHFPSFSDMHACLQSFRQLHTFCIQIVTVGGDPGPRGNLTVGAHPVKIKNLVLRNGPYLLKDHASAKHQYFSGFDLQSIATLTLEAASPSAWSIYHGLCERIGASLCELNIKPSHVKGVTLSNFNLTHCPRLRSLRVQDVDLFAGPLPTTFWLAELLESCPSKEVTNISYRMRIRAFGDLDWLDCYSMIAAMKNKQVYQPTKLRFFWDIVPYDNIDSPKAITLACLAKEWFKETVWGPEGILVA